jgi:hypothetical protein
MGRLNNDATCDATGDFNLWQKIEKQAVIARQAIPLGLGTSPNIDNLGSSIP